VLFTRCSCVEPTLTFQDDLYAEPTSPIILDTDPYSWGVENGFQPNNSHQWGFD
jgi:hypothetical protein